MSTGIVAVGVAGGFVLCYLILAPFLPAFVWSLTLALLFIPIQIRLENILGRPRIAAGLSVLLAAMIVVIPVVLVGTILLREAVLGFTLVAEMVRSDAWTDLLSRNPTMAAVAGWAGHWFNGTEYLSNSAASITNWSGKFVEKSITGLITLLITFFFLFYMLLDREKVRETLRDLLPFDRDEFAILQKRIVDTIFASVYGTLTIAAIQGTLGGLIFWWLGLPSPVFWGVLMGLLAIVPFLGAFIIWVPAAVFLALSGELASAIILIIWGTIIIGLIDNIIYPVLVGRRLGLHSAVSFGAIMGGLVLFGPSGIVLGPIIVALTQSTMLIWRARWKESEESSNGPLPETGNHGAQSRMETEDAS